MQVGFSNLEKDEFVWQGKEAADAQRLDCAPAGDARYARETGALPADKDRKRSQDRQGECAQEQAGGAHGT